VTLAPRSGVRGLDLEEDAAALTDFVVDPGQAFSTIRGWCAGRSALSWRREGMARTELRPKPPMDMAPHFVVLKW
jgi:hypothetical protein